MIFNNLIWDSIKAVLRPTCEDCSIFSEIVLILVLGDADSSSLLGGFEICFTICVISCFKLN